MKIKFKKQQYQIDAIESAMSVFAGQHLKTNGQYNSDWGHAETVAKAQFVADKKDTRCKII